MRITRCPKMEISSDVISFLHFSDLARDHSLLPVSGGVLDQSDSFMQACRTFWALEKQFENERVKNG